MPSIERIDPRKAQMGFITPDGVKRIARNRQLSADELTFSVQSKDSKKLHILTEVDSYILVVLLAKAGQLDSHDLEVVYSARVLSKRYENCAVLALVFGELNQNLGDIGVDKYVKVDFELYDSYNPTVQVQCIEKLYDQYKPKHCIFADSDWGDRELAYNFITRRGNLSYGTQIVEIDDNTIIRYRDNGCLEESRELTDIMVLCSNISEGELEFTCLGDKEDVCNIQDTATSSDKSFIFTLKAQDIPLEEAQLILSAGNGVTDMDIFHQCAKELDASVAASRVVVDDGKMPRDRQVGATGKNVAAKVYVALGISGAVQHLQGIKDCRYIVAVNTDESCPMMKIANLAIKDDAVEIMKSLLEIVQSDTLKNTANNTLEQTS